MLGRISLDCQVDLRTVVRAEALFLNDVVVAADGTVYHRQSKQRRLRVDRKYRVRAISSRPQLGGPNGIRLDGGSLSWVSGKVFRIGRSGADLTTIAEFV
jgi:hypothetical protein